ncbi:MAG: YbbR-like domain-containing protein, partial [Acidobacteriota bacterium]
MRISLRKNLYLKIFSFLLALVCWFVVSSEAERVKDFQVPIDYVGLPQALELSGRIIDTVGVRLRGPEQVLRTVTDDLLSARVDLSRVPLGEQYVPVTREMIRVPGGADVVRIDPELIPIHIEKRAQREVPVVAEFVGRPARGYRRGKYEIDPPVVTIEGPASAVARVKRAT